MRVEPIRDPREISRIEEILSTMNSQRGDRMLLMFEVGIWLGMRIGDMLRLSVGDIRGQSWLIYTPQKTDTRSRGGRPLPGYRAKQLKLAISPHLRSVVASLCEGQPDEAWLFPSPRDPARPIDRHTACNDVKYIGQLAGLRYNVGCHTLRKTFGYHIYRRDHDVAWLQTWYGHSSPATTLVYIGIADDDMRKAVDRPLYPGGVVDWQALRRSRAQNADTRQRH